ncbi:WecB/TagA/CpsF family glycosyltransferase [Dankookia sp. GCM10030260]|uniref:WecB/TagA/CpsF family glycosyltransferase n=1 Tax=Dankookia sp. GCM10030260 TaxID=3273390 RepID=UPI0036122780
MQVRPVPETAPLLDTANVAEMAVAPGKVNILGVGVSAIRMQDATATLEQWIARRSPGYVCITGVHGVMESQRDPTLKAIHNAAGMVTPDGVPLVWMSRMLGFPQVERVYGPDLMREMTALSARRGYRNYYYGGAPGTADRLKEVLTRAHPGLQVVGTCCPPFRPLTPEEDAATIAEINAAQPDIIWVGLSTPKQERWMAAHLGKLSAPAMVGVGAAFDFLSGQKPQAPRWMQRNGLEWAFRMATEPRRLAGRYVRNNPAFVVGALRQLVDRRRFPQMRSTTPLQ